MLSVDGLILLNVLIPVTFILSEVRLSETILNAESKVSKLPLFDDKSVLSKVVIVPAVPVRLVMVPLVLLKFVMVPLVPLKFVIIPEDPLNAFA